MSVFDLEAERYDRWFDTHRSVYLSELNAVRSLWPQHPGRSLEIGAGTGRFADPLHIDVGVEPSAAMRAVARQGGMSFLEGVAEALPLEDGSFDTVLMVTTICFLNDPDQAFREIYRVLKKGGTLLIGFVDRQSRIGRQYEAHKSNSVFYHDARFFSVKEVLKIIACAGFDRFEFRQTLFNELESVIHVEPVKEGYGKGSFVVIAAHRDS